MFFLSPFTTCAFNFPSVFFIFSFLYFLFVFVYVCKNQIPSRGIHKKRKRIIFIVVGDWQYPKENSFCCHGHQDAYVDFYFHFSFLFFCVCSLKLKWENFCEWKLLQNGMTFFAIAMSDTDVRWKINFDGLLESLMIFWGVVVLGSG